MISINWDLLAVFAYPKFIMSIKISNIVKEADWLIGSIAVSAIFQPCNGELKRQREKRKRGSKLIIWLYLYHISVIDMFKIWVDVLVVVRKGQIAKCDRALLILYLYIVSIRADTQTLLNSNLGRHVVKYKKNYTTGGTTSRQTFNRKLQPDIGKWKYYTNVA